MKSIKKMNGEVDNLTHFLILGVLAVFTVILIMLILNFIINILCVVFLSG